MSDELTFEQRLDELESVVSDLESGELSLEDMLSRYEYGMKLVTSCQQRLAEAELRVTEIAADSARDDEDLEQIPF
ncbi:MAG TPA: exodeoxyribonuclease VII small subunit [Thermomicrobiales bacterium]|nr:exodeoxyribonuclease VII small subunit [Thermomicrobiales bacterium]HYH12761.1 exodeoxyribonuclease VII small subunit [Thermomicrobiales bacterium]